MRPFVSTRIPVIKNPERTKEKIHPNAAVNCNAIHECVEWLAALESPRREMVQHHHENGDRAQAVEFGYPDA